MVEAWVKPIAHKVAHEFGGTGLFMPDSKAFGRKVLKLQLFQDQALIDNCLLTDSRD